MVLKKKYIFELIKKYPSIISGRKNYKFYEKRINNKIKMIKKYMKKNSY